MLLATAKFIAKLFRKPVILKKMFLQTEQTLKDDDDDVGGTAGESLETVSVRGAVELGFTSTG